MTFKKIKAVKDGIKKDKILKAATALFSKNVYAQTSIRGITKKSKVSFRNNTFIMEALK